MTKLRSRAMITPYVHLQLCNLQPSDMRHIWPSLHKAQRWSISAMSEWPPIGNVAAVGGAVNSRITKYDSSCTASRHRPLSDIPSTINPLSLSYSYRVSSHTDTRPRNIQDTMAEASGKAVQVKLVLLGTYYCAR